MRINGGTEFVDGGAPTMDPIEDNLLTLEAAVRDYLRERDNPVPDYALRRQLRAKLEKLVGR